jgi:hypothetical protein
VADDECVWIGLVGVGPLPTNTNLDGAKGAYVNALALAATVEDYQRAVNIALDQLALFAFEFEDVERFDNRSERMTLDADICVLADEARQSGHVRFGEFHRFAALDG